MTQRPTLLRLVHDKDAKGEQNDSTGHFEPVQMSFLAAGQRTLVVATTDSLDEVGFIQLFSELKPSIVVDLRTSPRFDFGKLNRRRVFAFFEGLDVRYVDHGAEAIDESFVGFLLGAEDISRPSVESLNSVAAWGVVVLVDSTPNYQKFGLELARVFRKVTSKEWNIVIQGPQESSESATDRKSIFISHANPEDNDFALWLQAQLTRNGFQVWTDITHLKAGEVFWETIEETIRRKAARVIVVNSKASQNKPGVQDEIGLAVSVERAERLPGFVVPIRLDDLPFSQFRANIARKNTIDFSSSWSLGLRQLLDTLRRDHIPTISNGGASALAEWWEKSKPKTIAVSSNPETLVSNQFEIESLPNQICILKGLPSFDEGKENVVSDVRQLPLVPHVGDWLSFYSAYELRQLGVNGLSKVKSISTDEFRKGNVSYSALLKSDARDRILVRLLNRHWEFYLLSRGLAQFDVARGAPTMFIPKGLLDKNQTELIDVDGIRRKRLLVGKSDKRKVYWHLGALGRFAIAETPVLKLRLRVIFTDEVTLEPVAHERMRDLRRRFCKNWWNNRWRTLQLGFAHWLSSGAKSLAIYSGESGVLQLSAVARSFLAPVSIDENIVGVNESIVDDFDFGDQLEVEGDLGEDDLSDEEHWQDMEAN